MRNLRKHLLKPVCLLMIISLLTVSCSKDVVVKQEIDELAELMEGFKLVAENLDMSSSYEDVLTATKYVYGDQFDQELFDSSFFNSNTNSRSMEDIDYQLALDTLDSETRLYIEEIIVIFEQHVVDNQIGVEELEESVDVWKRSYILENESTKQLLDDGTDILVELAEPMNVLVKNSEFTEVRINLFGWIAAIAVAVVVGFIAWAAAYTAGVDNAGIIGGLAAMMGFILGGQLE